jgi:hypothetical protein
MKKPAVITFIALIATIYSTTVFGQKFDINGLQLGMTKTEIEKKFGSLPLLDFKIANVSGKFPVKLEFYEDKLDELMFFFPSKSFEDVRKSVIARHPELKCTDSTITSPAGAKYVQTNCKLKDQLGTMRLDRFVMDINTSVLVLISHRLFQEQEMKLKSKQK